METRKEIKISKDWSAIIACSLIENIVMVSFFYKGVHVIKEYYRCFFNDYTLIVYEAIIEQFDRLFGVTVDKKKVFTNLKAFEKLAVVNDQTLTGEGAISFDHNGNPIFLMSDVNEVKHGA